MITPALISAICWDPAGHRFDFFDLQHVARWLSDAPAVRAGSTVWVIGDHPDQIERSVAYRYGDDQWQLRQPRPGAPATVLWTSRIEPLDNEQQRLLLTQTELYFMPPFPKPLIVSAFSEQDWPSVTGGAVGPLSRYGFDINVDMQMLYVCPQLIDRHAVEICMDDDEYRTYRSGFLSLLAIWIVAVGEGVDPLDIPAAARERLQATSPQAFAVLASITAAIDARYGRPLPQGPVG